MPTLILLRHAKSDWDDPSLADFDRPLAPRGVRDAPRMGTEILKRGWVPDTVLISPALRAWQTWDLASAKWDNPPEPAFEDRLYMATPATMRNLLRSLPEVAVCIMVVGHGPGLGDFALSLAGPDSDERALKRMKKKFPTAAMARFEFDGPWANLRQGTATLTHFVKPKDLKKKSAGKQEFLEVRV